MSSSEPEQGPEFDLNERAREFAENVHEVARQSANEDELRIDMSRLIRDLADDLDVDIDPEHERTVISGRPDSVYGDLAIEYKDPNRSDNWQHEAIYGRNESDNGLVDYIYDLASDRSHDEEEQRAALDRMIGVGTNGYKIFFCRYEPEKQIETVAAGQTQLTSALTKEEVERGIEVIDVYRIQDGARRFLTYLRSLQRRPLTSEKLAESFGPEGDAARETVKLLYEELQEGRETSDRVEMLYEEWNRVFGVVYGEEIDQVQEDREEFGSVYGIEDPEVRPLLFSVHTYYALLMKMLVKELVASVGTAAIQEAELYEPDDEELKRKLRELESGKEFQLVGLKDFFEEGFFAWYLDIWNEELADQIRELVEELQGFEAATPAIKPEVVRDILKDLYQSLVPRVIRHDLGEFFTPDWLAEHTLDHTDFEEGRMLDPACGSGTFLVESIQSIRQQSESEGEELLEEILHRTVGFDLNPISVIASRTNYLMSLGDLAFTTDEDIRIPVYQCDSILSPSKYVDLTTQGEQAYRVPTREGEFRIPALGQEGIETLLSLAEQYIQMDAEEEAFMSAVDRELDLDDKWVSLTRNLYTELYELHQENKNKVWPQLLRNRIAPEFVGDFDHVVGNPPWVNWENLSEEYREITSDVWEEYELFEFSGYDARISRDDICILMTYVALDEYLKDDGNLVFLLPQTLFQTHRGGYGFRRFSIPKREGTKRVYEPVSVERVADLSAFDPFEGASNQTAIVDIRKGEETTYPVDYRIWNPQSVIYPDDTLEEALDKVEFVDVAAEPVQENDNRTEWLTLEPGAIEALRSVLGESDYQGREGTNTLGADGLYNVEILDLQDDCAVIQNIPTEGRQQSIRDRGAVRGKVETDILYPTLKGRHLGEWSNEPEMHLLVPHKDERGPHSGIPEEEMQRDYPHAYSYFQDWEDILRETRERNSKFYDPEVDPFYLADNMGEYSFAPYKLAWREVADRIQSTVLEPVDIGLDEKKPIIPTHTVIYIPFDEKNAAHFGCAVMNSVFTRLAIRGYINMHPSPHILENIQIPHYSADNDLHNELAELSKRAHETDDESEIENIEKEINEKVRQLWNVSHDQLEQVKKSLKELNN